VKQYFRISPEGDIPVEVFKRLSLEARNHKAKDVCLTFERKRKKRTTPQLRYYYGYCLVVLLAHFLECGEQMTKDELDAFLRVNVLKVRKMVLGQWVPGHTEDLTPAEFDERLSWLRQWAAEVLCELDEPNEHLYQKLGVAV
jgi:hypothetical protein